MDDTREREFHDFVVARRGALVRIAYLLTGDPAGAEDLVQETMMRAHRHWGRARQTSPEAYVRRIMINLHCSWRRRLWTRMEKPTGHPPHEASGDPYAAVDHRDELCRSLLRLPARMRAALVLRFYADLSEVDTARALGCSTGTIKSQVSRGLDRLRADLGNDDRSPSETVLTSTQTAGDRGRKR